MTKLLSNQYIHEYYLTITFTILAAGLSWLIIENTPRYLFFVAFNFIIALSNEYLVNNSYFLNTKKYNLIKGILAIMQLIISVILIFLWII